MRSRTSKQQRGDIGEELARAYLEERGLVFVTANWSCKAGEIDLVLKSKDDCLVFVEVRVRRPTMYGVGAETVAWQKQRKLIRAAQWFMQKNQWWGDVRFDVVSIELADEGKPKIEHIEYAFEAG